MNNVKGFKKFPLTKKKM